MADGRIVIDTELDPSGAERGLSALQQSIDRVGNDGLANMGRNMQQVGNTVGKVFTGMGLAIGAGLGAGVVAAANFDTSMSKVQALSGATGTEFESLRGIAQEMGATTQFSASEAAEGLQ